MKDIIFKNFSFSYPDKEIYKNFNAEFSGGKINVVLGASGVGKTTLLNALTGSELRWIRCLARSILKARM